MPELIWPGKHLPNPAPASLTTEAVIFPQGRGYPNSLPQNRLVMGDNLSVMAGLLPEFEGCVNLIYADPPFFTNRKFSARIGRGEDSRKPEGWQLAEGYHDNWDDLDAYLQFLYERLSMMVRLLAPNGTLYLHLDWHADSYARLLLDELLGSDSLLNEIIWTYHGPSPIRTAFNRKHDTILVCVKGAGHTFNADAVREPYNPSTVKTFAASPKAGFGKIPNLARGKVPEDWWYFPVVARLHSERTGYPTQKPEALLERVILASSNPGDLVADFFCGSGTTALVAARTGRRFIAVDETFRAIHTTRKRLADTESAFTLERDSVPSFRTGPTTIRLGSVRTFGLQLSADTILLGNPNDIDYWEVDSDWDGKTFRSSHQAVRPARRGEIPSELKIKVGRRVCVRLVTVNGQQFQVELDVQAITNATDGL
jgi:site-specific DNA-methyltransferase (adenine-specific)